jgi:hypothetical protein
MYTVVFAAIAVVVCKFVPARPNVNVLADPEVFVTVIFVTTVVVADGTVYSVVPTVVVAAPRKSALVVVVAINYYLLSRSYSYYTLFF